MERVYLDWNASAPLRPQARAAMLAAMDVTGNPSSPHAQGREARALLEKARAQVARAFGAEGAEIVFVSGATEAAGLACAGLELCGAQVEHEAVRAWLRADLPVDDQGLVRVAEPSGCVLQLANSETGVVQDLPQGLALVDATQGFGKLPVAFNWMGCRCAMISAHKIGGPKGVGALVLQRGCDLVAQIRGGGQEMGRRAGTENLIGIAGFGAAAEAALCDLEGGVWERVEKLRNILELAIEDAAKETIFVGKAAKRLPNTSCFVLPGWKGETQVMQMDLAGFAVSAGSACSSGKVRASQVLRAMGYDDEQAGSAIRVSLGPLTQEEEVLRFAEAWIGTYQRRRGRGV